MSTMTSLSSPSGDGSRTAFARTITAIDITEHPGLRGLWFSGSCPDVDDAARARLPAGGVASPLGYWLVSQEGIAPPAGAGPRLVVCSPDGAPPEPPAGAHRAGRRFRTQTVRLKAPAHLGGDLRVTIGPGSARVVAEEPAWEALREPILFAICQAWRFQSIDAELERLTRSALDDLHYANAPGLASLPQSRRLMGLGLNARAAIVDLTHFEEPLTDPLAYLDSRRSARAYRTLAERFGLDDWCDAIDHRAEVVETTFETITEKLYHLKSHAHDVVLEVIIVIILLFDIVMRIWEVMV